VAVAGAEPGDPEAAAREFVAWLAWTPHRWLLVLDDVAVPGDLQGLWPPQHVSGRAVVTTRHRDAALSGPGRALLDVGVFRREEAVRYLTAKLAVHGRREDPSQLTELADALGDLPIALAQAVAYQIDAGLDSTAYLARRTDRRRTLADLAPHPGALPDDQQRALAAVGSLSVQHASELPPPGLARPLMEPASVLDPNGIPVSVLTSDPALRYLAARRVGPEGPVDPEDALDALHVLRRVSLADLDDGRPESTAGAAQRIVRVHALPQRAVREQLSPDEQAQAVLAAADALLAAWPAAGIDPIVAFGFRSNLLHLHGHGEAVLWRSGCHPLPLHAGRNFVAENFPAAGVVYWESLAAAAEKHLGAAHPHTFAIRTELADLRGTLGGHVRARDDVTLLAAECARVLGPDHPEPPRDAERPAQPAHLAGLRRRPGRGARGGPGTGRRPAAGPGTRASRHHGGAPQPGALAGLGRRHPGPARRTGRTPRGAGAGLRSAALPDPRGPRQHRALSRSGPRPERPGGTRPRLPGRHPPCGGRRPSDRHRHARPHRALDRPRRAPRRGRRPHRTRTAGPFRAGLGPPDTLVARSCHATLVGTAGDPAAAAEELSALIPDVEHRFGPGNPASLQVRHHQLYWRAQTGADPALPADPGLLAAADQLIADHRSVLAAGHPLLQEVLHNAAAWRGDTRDAAIIPFDLVSPWVRTARAIEDP
jgi:hypothetical protein